MHYLCAYDDYKLYIPESINFSEWNHLSYTAECIPLGSGSGMCGGILFYQKTKCHQSVSEKNVEKDKAGYSDSSMCRRRIVSVVDIDSL